MTDCDLDVSVSAAGLIPATIEPPTELSTPAPSATALAASTAPSAALAATVVGASALSATPTASPLSVSVSEQQLDANTDPQPPYFIAPEEIDMTPGVELFVADGTYRVGTTDWLSTGGDNSWISDISRGTVQQLGFCITGVWRFTATGYYEQPAGTNTIHVQALIDGAGFGPILSMGTISAFVGTANWQLDFVVAVVGAPTDIPKQQVSAHLVIFQDDGTVLHDQVRYGMMQVDETVEHTMTLQMRKASATADHVLDVRSLNGLWECKRSGT